MWVAVVVGGEVFGRVPWEGAEPGADDDEVGAVVIVVGGRGSSLNGGRAVEGDFVGQSDGLHCLDGVDGLHLGSHGAVLVYQPIPDHTCAVSVFV